MPTFEAAARKVNLTGAEFLEIADYLSRHPEAGDVIKAPAACPKGNLSAGELKQLSKIAAAVKQEAQ